MKFNEIEQKFRNRIEDRILTMKKDYEQGMRDCSAGEYDKWYQYNRPDEGYAYDQGWLEKKKEIYC